MRLANAFCRFAERARGAPWIPPDSQEPEAVAAIEVLTLGL
jgi:hypothetical protein